MQKIKDIFLSNHLTEGILIFKCIYAFEFIMINKFNIKRIFQTVR